MTKVPVVDYNDYFNNRKKFVKKFYKGLKEVGFIILKNHPVDLKLIKSVYKQMEDFFLKDQKFKNKFLNKKIKQTGYIPFGVEHAKDKSPNQYDLKEFWQVSRELRKGSKYEKYIYKNVWTGDKNFDSNLKKLYKSFDALSQDLLEALGEALDIEKGYFKKLVTNGNSILRVIHYPPLDGLKVDGNVRAAAHEDINLLTIMPGASETGLEILTKENTWLPIEANYDYLIIDSGDMISRITNDKIKATTHRVVNPKDPKTRRLSMPFFVHPNPEALLKCLESCLDFKKYSDGKKYPDIKSNDFLMERLREIGLKK